MEFTDSDELRRDILANQYLPEHLRERAKNDTSEYCRAEDADNLLEVDRLTGHGLVRFHFESGNASMRMLAPKLPAGASPVLHSTWDGSTGTRGGANGSGNWAYDSR